MASRKPPKRALKARRDRALIEKRLGASCPDCGLQARRVSDSYCSSCGIPLNAAKTAVPAVSKAGRAAQANALKAAVTEMTAELAPKLANATARIDAMGAEIARRELLIEKLEADANGFSPLASIRKSAVPLNPYEVDPFTTTVDGLPIHNNPVIAQGLQDTDPSVREAAWQSIYGKRS